MNLRKSNIRPLKHARLSCEDQAGDSSVGPSSLDRMSKAGAQKGKGSVIKENLRSFNFKASARSARYAGSHPQDKTYAVKNAYF